MLGALKRMSYKADRQSIKRVAEAKIISKIAYGAMFYILPNIKGLIDPNYAHKEIKKVINQASRIILKKSREDRLSSHQLRCMSGLKSLNEIVIQQLLKESWHLIHDKNHFLKETNT